jgi:hypothetical protein
MTVFAGGLRTNQVESHKDSLPSMEVNFSDAILRMRLCAPTIPTGPNDC